MGVSSGEIFDSERVIGDPANQIDVVIYTKNFPKIRIVSEEINAFMCESVHAIIEVKSFLDEDELDKAYTVANRICSLNNEYFKQKNWRTWRYVVAFESKATLPTVASWLVRSARKKGATGTLQALTGVFVLGKGFVLNPTIATYMEDRTSNLVVPPAGNLDWLVVQQETGGLYALFFALNFLQYGITIFGMSCLSKRSLEILT